MTDPRYTIPTRSNGKTVGGILGQATGRLGIKGSSPEGMAILGGSMAMLAILTRIQDKPDATDGELVEAAIEALSAARDPRRPLQ